MGLPSQPPATPKEDAKRVIRYRLIGCEFELDQALDQCARNIMGRNLELRLQHAIEAVRSALDCTGLKL